MAQDQQIITKDIEFDKLYDEIKDVEEKLENCTLIWKNFSKNCNGIGNQFKETFDRLRMVYPEDSPYNPILEDAVRIQIGIVEAYEHLVNIKN